MLHITAEGAIKAQLSLVERRKIAHGLLSGSAHISKYNTGICHDTVA